MLAMYIFLGVCYIIETILFIQIMRDIWKKGSEIDEE